MTSIAAWLLSACGTGLVGIGGFFLLARPFPMLGTWLRHVFWVLGGYIATTGILVLDVANTSLRPGSAGALVLLAIAGATSLGWMSVVNFLIRSDFRWALFSLDLLWVLGLLLALAGR